MCDKLNSTKFDFKHNNRIYQPLKKLISVGHIDDIDVIISQAPPSAGGRQESGTQSVQRAI